MSAFSSFDLEHLTVTPTPAAFYRLSLQLLYGTAGLFALMLAWPFVVSFSRLILVGRLGGDALIWLMLGALSISASMLLFNTTRHVASLSGRQHILRGLLACALATPATVMLLMFAANPP
ncbi:MAG: hypothetical protein RLY58_895 [Pseudomonadota bacterium]|jgi:hypothetical protein